MSGEQCVCSDEVLDTNNKTLWEGNRRESMLVV